MSRSKLPSFGRFFSAFFIAFLTIGVHAQSSSFTFQGKLNDAGAAANGTYEMQFSLFDAVVGGNQISTTDTIGNVTVTNGIFTVRLTFGTLAFDGNPRFLEIAVRPAGSSNPFTVLAPRQSVLSAPYSVRALTAGTADLATNSNQLGGIAPGGFIKNTTTQQPNTNFSISGNGTLGGNFSANSVNSESDFTIGNSTVLTVNGVANTYVGLNTGIAGTTGDFGTFVGSNAGKSNTTGTNNSFFGANAGFSNTSGVWNSFFGSQSGALNTTGSFNSFFGYNAGNSNTTAVNNSFFGQGAGFKNTTGQDNTFVGNGAGQNNSTASNTVFVGSLAGFNNTTGASNAFVGTLTGSENTTGINNAYFGNSAGRQNTTGNSNTFVGNLTGTNNLTGSGNTFVGVNSGLANTTGTSNTLLGNSTNFGAGNLNFATAIGAGAVVSTSSTIVLGRAADTVQVPGSLNVAGTFGANIFNAVTQYNIGGNRFLSNFGTNNIFAGVNSGTNNSSGNGNAFFGSQSGNANTTGINNAFFGFNAGSANLGGGANTFIGVNAGLANVGSSNNTFLGANAGNSNLTSNGNTYLGANSDGGFLITNSVAIGQKAFVGQSNSLILGSINGVNTATADTLVGIGTSTPTSRLHLVNNTDFSFLVESSAPLGAGIELKSNRSTPHNWLIYTGDNQNFGYNLFFLDKTTNTVVMSLRGDPQGGGVVNVDGLLAKSIFMDTPPADGDAPLCLNSFILRIARCSDSLTQGFKKDLQKDIRPFSSGLSFLNRFKPVAFRWQSSDKADFGFVAEDLAKIDPLLVNYNAKGEIEGVKYDRISAVLVNAVKEQQTRIETQEKQNLELKKQIEMQQKQLDEQKAIIEGLKKLLCQNNGQAEVCK
jgi:hypothetical protein